MLMMYGLEDIISHPDIARVFMEFMKNKQDIYQPYAK